VIRWLGHTDEVSGLFRTNSLCTRAISLFVQTYSVWSYFHGLLAAFFKDLASKPLDVAVDIEEHELNIPQAARTVEFLQAVCLRMVDRLVQSGPTAPR
jgi:hypothetical protein